MTRNRSSISYVSILQSIEEVSAGDSLVDPIVTSVAQPATIPHVSTASKKRFSSFEFSCSASLIMLEPDIRLDGHFCMTLSPRKYEMNASPAPERTAQAPAASATTDGPMPNTKLLMSKAKRKYDQADLWPGQECSADSHEDTTYDECKRRKYDPPNVGDSFVPGNGGSRYEHLYARDHARVHNGHQVQIINNYGELRWYFDMRSDRWLNCTRRRSHWITTAVIFALQFSKC